MHIHYVVLIFLINLLYTQHFSLLKSLHINSYLKEVKKSIARLCCISWIHSYRHIEQSRKESVHK